ncbi:Peptidyl-prolyl cis-trans isomerase FKBP13, chloroplastic [Galdieria sulphuraria]|nr:Peptidyl-prolyl cis-trans isomerase FKBP13, chloroplastic [Galdieria sulphuraria]
MQRRQFVRLALVAFASVSFPLKIQSLAATEQLEALKLSPFNNLRFVTLEPGLKVAEISQGSGPQPLPGDICVVEYTGYLSNGQVFDSTSAKGRKPIAFLYGKGQVIPGWEIGLRDMRPGGRRVLVISPSLAYGEQGVCLEGYGCYIPPKETLVFDVSLFCKLRTFKVLTLPLCVQMILISTSTKTVEKIFVY